MSVRLPIGFSDFAQIRREGLHYVDKTGLVADVVRSARQVVLLPRPRRFGKTLNITMLRAFFEPNGGEVAALFDGLAVAGEGADVRDHMGRHPVVCLTFKDVKHRTWADCWDHLRQVIGQEVRRHRETCSVAGTRGEARDLDPLLDGTTSLAAWADALRRMSAALGAATGEQVVVLIDEYDTPIHSGFACGYHDEVVAFFRNLLGAGLKDNPWLFRGVITGILRVAKESIFSGLNNVDTHTLLSPQFADWFGFTEREVEALARLCDQEADLPVLRRWYDGYRVGEHRVYNPWSVLNQLVRPGQPPQPWWVNTASDEILRELLVSSGLGLHDDLSALLRGEAIHRRVSEDIVLRDVRRRADALWSFLLFSGYLTADAPLSRDADGRPDSPLRIPNHEVSVVYRTVFAGWMDEALSTWSDAPRRLGRALLGGDARTFEDLLDALILRSLSTFDLGGRTPEAVYQAFVVGLLVHLEATHEVRSNRESGHGRYDVLVKPRRAGEAGAVLELKVLDERRGETPEKALDAALAQVRDRAYATELRAAGAAPVWQWGGVFDGKRAWARVEGG